MQFVVTTNTDLEITLKEFLIDARARGLSPRTVQAYRWHLKRLVTWLAERGIESLRMVTRNLLREWTAGLYEQWQRTTVKQAVSAMRSWFKWAYNEQLISSNPAKAVKVPRDKPKMQRTVSSDEFEQMLAACPETVTGIRNRAIISLLFDSGLRAAEVARLRAQDVWVEQQVLKVKVKGGATGPGWFGEATAQRIKDWLDVRQAAPGVKTLFTAIGGNTPGHRMTPGGVSHIVAKISLAAGLDRASAHALRRGFAVSMTEAGVQTTVLMDLGRWETELMIKRYTLGLQAGRVYQGNAPADRSKLFKNKNDPK